MVLNFQTPALIFLIGIFSFSSQTHAEISRTELSAMARAETMRFLQSNPGNHYDIEDFQRTLLKSYFVLLNDGDLSRRHINGSDLSFFKLCFTDSKSKGLLQSGEVERYLNDFEPAMHLLHSMMVSFDVYVLSQFVPLSHSQRESFLETGLPLFVNSSPEISYHRFIRLLYSPTNQILTDLDKDHVSRFLHPEQMALIDQLIGADQLVTLSPAEVMVMKAMGRDPGKPIRRSAPFNLVRLHSVGFIRNSQLYTEFANNWLNTQIAVWSRAGLINEQETNKLNSIARLVVVRYKLDLKQARLKSQPMADSSILINCSITDALVSSSQWTKYVSRLKIASGGGSGSPAQELAEKHFFDCDVVMKSFLFKLTGYDQTLGPNVFLTGHTLKELYQILDTASQEPSISLQNRLSHPINRGALRQKFVKLCHPVISQELPEAGYAAWARVMDLNSSP